MGDQFPEGPPNRFPPQLIPPGSAVGGLPPPPSLMDIKVTLPMSVRPSPGMHPPPMMGFPPHPPPPIMPPSPSDMLHAIRPRPPPHLLSNMLVPGMPNNPSMPNPNMANNGGGDGNKTAVPDGNGDEKEQNTGNANNSNNNTTSAAEDEQKKAELVLPKALEDALAFKDQRAAEFHTSADNIFTLDAIGQQTVATTAARLSSTGVISRDYADAGEESDDESELLLNGVADKKQRQSKAEKNKKKKRRKKLNKKMRKQTEAERQQQDVDREVDEQATKDDTTTTATTTKTTDAQAAEEATTTTTDGCDGETATETAAAAAEKVHENGDDDKLRKKSDNKRDTKDAKKDKDKDEEKEKIVAAESADNDNVTIEYVPERITIADLAPMYRQFYRVFEIFKLENKPKLLDKEKAEGELANGAAQKKLGDKLFDEEEEEQEEEPKDDREKLSKRKLKKLTRLSVAELKQLVSRPDVVEMHDVTARDPKLLVQLKAYRNTVQVPRHWCFKRKYLQGKRGIEKPPFDLPAFIKKTGIMEMRESLQERDDAKSLKSKMRERVRPKMGKIDIDYQKLHDAFFKWQTKPRMTIHGDLYYEGKEFETRLKEKKPGDLSEELRIALGMPVGPNSHKIPPPWLIAQQRYGPPPSYPNLKIPGLNAPIPDGTSFGYHAGGWGKPPVDETGKPLYGDVFGTNIADVENALDEGDIERGQWGELESESEESSEEEESEGEDMTNMQDDGLVTPAEGLVTPSGLTSVPAGMETPESIELRKKKIEQEMDDNETPVLYQVLPEKRTDRIGASMMGSTHVYDIGAVGKQANVRPPAGLVVEREGTIELALDPSELDLDNDAMAQRYEQQMREQQSHLQKEDLSDMLAEHVARQKSKRKRQQASGTTETTSKSTKKYKEFKF